MPHARACSTPEAPATPKRHSRPAYADKAHSCAAQPPWRTATLSAALPPFPPRCRLRKGVASPAAPRRTRSASIRTRMSRWTAPRCQTTPTWTCTSNDQTRTDVYLRRPLWKAALCAVCFQLVMHASDAVYGGTASAKGVHRRWRHLGEHKRVGNIRSALADECVRVKIGQVEDARQLQGVRVEGSADGGGGGFDEYIERREGGEDSECGATHCTS
ncbi:hypothetical protein FGB62_39g014 [Gracilaria domingensis]|nr:hypothetical protein FGB62_39g08 [Gracilaria domingensis]KAI0563475.1 hypothetical protein FGB62_39g011 [Gracilaria domingensis]KAI0563477.1 hypothetical protein FGB62_39g017 [Gracilaria domingensis]KAI0563478.1 hypothetical protein FGB62_39g014 [Gracilaria domingensis]